MSKKSFKIHFDSPFITIFAVLAFVVFMLDTFALEGKAVQTIFSCPGSKGFDTFNFSNPLSYFRLIFHILGNQVPLIFLTSLLTIFFMGPQMEKRYGTVILILMTSIAALVSGALNACLCSKTSFGCESMIFLLIFLCTVDSILKKHLDISNLLAYVVYISFVIYNGRENLGSIPQSILYATVSLIGGVCGGILGFFVVPKVEKPKTEKKIVDPSTAPTEVADKKRRRPKKLKKVFLEKKEKTETILDTL